MKLQCQKYLQYDSEHLLLLLFCIFRFFPGKSDHGAFLSCRAENPHLKENNAVEDQWKIKVQCKENNVALY